MAKNAQKTDNTQIDVQLQTIKAVSTMKWKVFAIIESLDLLTGCDGIEEGDAADSTKKEIEACQYTNKAFATFLTVSETKS